jgi:hypothetical protein
MPGWLLQNLHVVVAAIVTAAVLAVYYRWRAAALRRVVRGGAPVTFSAWLRGPVAPYPRRWREGHVQLGLGAPVWKPQFGIVRRPVQLPMSAVVEQIRRVSGVREIFSVSANCMVMLVHAEEVTIELAVRAPELLSVLQALESRSGGGWRVPSTVAVNVVEAGEVTGYELNRW